MSGYVKDKLCRCLELYCENTSRESGMLLDQWEGSYVSMSAGSNIFYKSTGLIFLMVSVSMLLAIYFMGMKFPTVFSAFYLTFLFMNIHWSISSWISEKVDKTKPVSFSEGYNPGLYYIKSTVEQLKSQEGGGLLDKLTGKKSPIEEAADEELKKTDKEKSGKKDGKKDKKDKASKEKENKDKKNKDKKDKNKEKDTKSKDKKKDKTSKEEASPPNNKKIVERIKRKIAKIPPPSVMKKQVMRAQKALKTKNDKDMKVAFEKEKRSLRRKDGLLFLGYFVASLVTLYFVRSLLPLVVALFVAMAARAVYLLHFSESEYGKYVIIVVTILVAFFLIYFVRTLVDYATGLFFAFTSSVHLLMVIGIFVGAIGRVKAVWINLIEYSEYKAMNKPFPLEDDKFLILFTMMFIGSIICNTICIRNNNSSK